MPTSVWTITNATSKKNLVVLDASANSTMPDVLYYEQTITLLSLDSGDYLKPATADSITIPAEHKDSSGNTLTYTFIIAEAETLAPVKVVSFKADLSDMTDLVIDETAVSVIDKTFDFNKNVTAFPASELAMRFSALDLNDQNAVDSFFKNTKDYKEVTLETLHLLHSYYNAFPYGWADKKDITIFLYSGSFTTSEDTDAVTSIGTISITNDWTLPMPVNVPERFKIELKLNDDKARQLIFSKGAFWDSLNTDTARLSLAAAFIVPGQLTLDDSGKDIVTFLAGTINGNNAFGIQADSSGKQNNGEDFPFLFNVHSVKGWLSLSMYFIGISIGIGLLVKLSQLVAWYKKYGKIPADPVERAAQIEQQRLAIEANAQSLASQVNAQINVPQQDQLPAAQAALREQQIDLKTDAVKANIQQMIDAQYEALDLISNEYSSRDMQIAFDNLGIIELNAGEIDADNFSAFIEDTKRRLNWNAETIVAAETFIANRFTTAELNAYKDYMKEYEDIHQIMEDSLREINEIKGGEDEGEIIEEVR